MRKRIELQREAIMLLRVDRAIERGDEATPREDKATWGEIMLMRDYAPCCYR